MLSSSHSQSNVVVRFGYSIGGGHFALGQILEYEIYR